MNAAPPSDGNHLKEPDFRRLAQFIEGYCGIRMPPAKKTLVEGRLRRRVRALGLADINQYCRYLFDQDGLHFETVHLIDAVTTNKTEFFREAEHFDLLTDLALPDMLAGHERVGLDRPLKVWSAACSTGAEPYTLAIVLQEFSQALRGFRFSILGTDICTNVLAQAKLAIYPEDMILPVPPAYRQRYFLRSRDPAAAKVRVTPTIRQMVHFGRLNLMESSYPVDQMDVIFCRNILIYFEKQTQEEVLQRLCERLRPGGYLFVGHTETLTGMSLPLKQAATSVFVRK